MSGGLWNRLFTWFRRGEMLKWIVLGMIIGTFAGLFAAGFFYCLELCKHFTFETMSGVAVPSPAGEVLYPVATSLVKKKWVFFILPAAAGLLSGIIVYSIAPEAEGHGEDAMMESFHFKLGKSRRRVPFVKAVASIITLAGGGSAGREGPIVQIGASIGSWLGDVLKLSAHDRRILLLAGTGGGLGAIFRAPLGGAITACELIYMEDLETDALIPTVISSITSYTIFSQIFAPLFHYRPIFQIPNLTFNDPHQLIYYVILGLVCVPCGLFYITVFRFLHDRVFKPMPIPNHFKPMIGGLAVGLIGLYVPQVYSAGWGHLQMALLGQLTWKLMAAIVVFKIIATCFTITSGGSGGLFGPTLLIGGMIGGVVGVAASKISPEYVSYVDVGAFVLVGMAAFFAGVAHAPLGALLMVTEMTSGYHLIAPLLTVTAIAIIFNRKWSIYQKQVKNKFASPAHIGEFTVNVLEEMRVNDIFERREMLQQIPANATFAEVQTYLSYEDQELWPVVRDNGEVMGILSLDTTKPILFEDGLDKLLIAQDLAIPAAHVHPNDSIYQALLEFLKYPISAILVAEEDDENEILGILHHRDLIRAYNNEIIKRKGKD